MKKFTAVSLILAAALGGCASTGRLATYGWDTADARHNFGGRTFSIYVHPKDNVLLVQGSIADSAATVPAEVMKMVADDFLKDTGCTTQPATEIAMASFELPYSCGSLDLRTLILSQRATLTQGAKLVIP